jgi:methylenetetrahydrofolate dehydrogenase (NADP+) / methenyltetrahydrofolate cyclohydrolase
MARRLDGKAVAQKIYDELLLRIEDLRRQGIVPCLGAILVGDDPSSRLYVQNKQKACERMGLRSIVQTFPADISEAQLLDHIERWNQDPDIHGILVQLPLPSHLSKTRILEAIDPRKDVDGFHPVNKGLLMENRARLVPCTPAGILRMLDAYGIPIEGRHCVVVGRSDVVGKPIATLLLHRNATVTICHSRTMNLPDLVRSADILVTAIGRAAYIQPDWVNPEATLVDVGINTVTAADVLRQIVPEHHPKWAAFRQQGRVLLGDVHPLAYERVRAYTPVPGGVGPLTVAMLVYNTVTAAELQAQERGA